MILPAQFLAWNSSTPVTIQHSDSVNMKKERGMCVCVRTCVCIYNMCVIYYALKREGEGEKEGEGEEEKSTECRINILLLG